MNRGAFSAPERLIYEVQAKMKSTEENLDEHLSGIGGVIVELKKEYFSQKLPLNDDETLVHKLCVRLENILRYGAREKYTFMGARKDYWNYISDSIPKDETVKSVQSVSDIKTYQGKGRAFLRQALMEKSLADTLQRCSINERMTKEYYLTDSIFRNDQLLQNLIHSLYDLNAVDFQLPYKGYDLDRSFPSFSRKSFGDKRSMSTASEQDFLPADPVLLLNKNVDGIFSCVGSWLGIESTPVEQGHTDLSLQNIIDKVIILSEDITKIKARTRNEIETLTLKTVKLKEENNVITAENDLRVKQLNERFASIQKIDTATTSDKFKDLYDKLVATQLTLTETEGKYRSLEQESNSLKQQLENTLEDYETLKSEKEDVSASFDELTSELAQLKHHETTVDSTHKILENKLSELQKINDSLAAERKQLNENLLEKDSLIKMKDSELSSLQEAFEKSTGLVVGSFKELKDELSNQLKEKVDTLHNVTSANDDLSSETKSLQSENNSLTQQKIKLEKSILDITVQKEDAEKIVSELKLKLTDEKNAQTTIMQFVNELSTILQNESENLDVEDGLDNEDGLLKKKKKKINRVEHAEMTKVSARDEREAALRRVLEMQQEMLDLKSEKKESEKELMGLKYELSSVNKSLKELQDRCEGNNQEKSSSAKKCEDLEREVSRLNVEVDKYNGEIFNMSLEISKLNEEVLQKEGESIRAKEDLSQLQSVFNKMKGEKLAIETKQSNSTDELSIAKTNIDELRVKLDGLSVEHNTVKDQLESKEALEKSINEELDFMKKELGSTLLIKNEEIQSLKFQSSTEEMKKENILKELLEVKSSKAELIEQLTEREEKLKQLETEQLRHKTTLELENESLADENNRIHQEFSELKEKHEIAKKEITFLKVQVGKLAKEKDEEKATRINGWNRLNNLIEEKKTMEEKYKEQIKQLNGDIEEMKKHLVNLTKDKHELWTKKDQMEFELKQRAEDRWVNDEEVASCTNCQDTFSLTLRKHHCRLCGHIYCHKCSNNWLKTQHNKKKIRSCNVCKELYLETHGSDMIDGGSEKDSIISSDQLSITEESFDEYRKNLTTIPQEHESPNDDDADIEEDPFEILDPSDVSSSGSFGESEQISISSKDLKLASLLPTVNDENVESTLVVKEKVELQVPAGLRALLPVLIGNNKFELIWEFSSTPKDVGFGIAYKDSEDSDDDTIQTSVPLSRYISHKQTIHGRMNIEKPGVYYLIFNNSYSRLTSKNVLCSVGLIPNKK